MDEHDEDVSAVTEAFAGGTPTITMPSAAFMVRVRDAVSYSYEAGGYPEDMDEDVARYLEPDGGLLASLDLVIRLLEEREHALPQFREIVHQLP